jgi:hypothetical protein
MAGDDAFEDALVLNDANSIYFADATLASTFVARWCVGSKVKTTGGVFQVRDDEPAPRGCTGRREARPMARRQITGRLRASPYHAPLAAIPSLAAHPPRDNWWKPTPSARTPLAVNTKQIQLGQLPLWVESGQRIPIGRRRGVLARIAQIKERERNEACQKFWIVALLVVAYCSSSSNHFRRPSTVPVAHF